VRTTDLLLSRFEKELRPIARKRLATGQLPRWASLGFGNRFGAGAPCALCDKPIQPEEIEYEIKPIGAAVQILRLHRACHSAWQLECDRLNRRLRRNPRTPH
jgi:hypothetical protein